MRKNWFFMLTTTFLSAIVLSGCNYDSDPVPLVKVKNANEDRTPVIVDDSITICHQV